MDRLLPRRGPLASTLVRHVLLGLVGLAIAYGVTTSVGAYRDSQLTSVGYYVVALAGLTLLTGSNGQISLGHGAFMAVGGYTVALLLADQAWPFWATLFAAVLVTAATGGLVGAAAARLRGPYLAGATLAFAVGLPALTDKFSGFLGGSNGISVTTPAAPASLGATFPLERWQSWIAWLAAIATLVLLANLQRSRFGRTFRAVRDDEVAAELAGVHVARTQVLAFVVSAGCAGLAGGLLVMTVSVAGPGSFDLTLSISLLAGIVIGGLGRLAGAIWGGFVLVFFPVWASDLAGRLNLSTDVGANLPVAAYGVLLIAVMLAFPAGVQGGLHRLALAGARLLARRSDPARPSHPQGSSPPGGQS